MKKRVIAAILTAGLSATLLLTSCTQGNQQLQFNPNWHQDTSSSNELYDGIDETLTYDISFSASEGLNSGKYDVNYCVDASGAPLPGSYVLKTTGNDATGYELRATATIPVLYTYDEATVWHEEKMESVVRFGKTGTKLNPSYSFSSINSYAPSWNTPTKLEECFVEYDYTLEITYANESAGIEQTVSVCDNVGTFLGEVKTDDTIRFDIDRSTYTYLDNEQIFFALRGLNNSTMAGTSYFNSYNLAKKNVVNYAVTAKEQGSTKDFKDTTINEVPIGDVAVDYNAVTLTLNEKNRGAGYELWYAKTTSANSNAYRNVLLKIKQDANLAMGHFNYTLKSATWN